MVWQFSQATDNISGVTYFGVTGFDVPVAWIKKYHATEI
jgi:hypothetical protein